MSLKLDVTGFGALCPTCEEPVDWAELFIADGFMRSFGEIRGRLEAVKLWPCLHETRRPT